MKYNSKKEKAISYITEEIRSLELAPELNGCPMKPEWAEQLDIMRTCLEAVSAYPPAHIDREAWEPCELCGGDKLDGFGVGDHFGLRAYIRGGDKKPPKNERFQFCPKCGRPRTPEAWAELEKRLMG